MAEEQAASVPMNNKDSPRVRATLTVLPIATPIPPIPLDESFESRAGVTTETIDSRGGTIQLPYHGISLCIPVFALQQSCKITLKVLHQPSRVLFAENEAIVSPGVVCEPSGTTFEKPLKLVIPHCAVLTDPSKAKVTMHFTNGDTKIIKKEMSSTGTPRCIVGKDVFEVYITNFSICEMFMVISDNFIGKRVASTPYLPKSMSHLHSKYCHLRLYNDTPGTEDFIEKQEKRLRYQKMAPTRKNLFVLWKTGELKIRWEVDSGHDTENEKTVSLDDIYRLDRNNVNFLVKGTSDANVPFKINMHLHCNEEHAFGVKYSGITETSQGITNSTSPRPSASTPVDISPQGASACTSNARKVSDEMLNSLAQHVPTYAYNKFSGKLGIEHNQAGNILDKYKSDYEKATRECLAKWMDRSNRDVADLHEVLRAVDLGGLIIYCN